ncbi:MAG: ABC transporter ATP-binding protein [Lactobacillus sp.]|nr:ABC transporter ATP-binding protein [Lactobacillus sp.]
MSLKYAPKYRVFLFIIFCIIKACDVLFIAYMIKLMLNLASSNSKDVGELIKLATIAGCGQLFFTCSNFFYEHLKMTIIKNVNLVLKNANLHYLVAQGKSDIKSGLSLMTNDLKQIETGRVTAQLDMCYQSILFIGSLSFAFINSWQMTIIFIVASIAPAIVQILTSKLITRKAKTWANANADYTQHVSDSLNGAPAAKLYNVQATIISRAIFSAKKMEEALRSMNFTQAWALELIYTVAELCCFIIPCTIGGILMMHGQLKVGTLVLMVDLAMNFITPVVTIFQEFNQVKSTDPMWKKTLEALNYTNKPEKVVTKAKENFNNLKIKNLGYRTNKTNTEIFNNINFTITPGKKTLLMAPSGWGKTTLLKLMMGDKKPSHGQILINDHNLTNNWQGLHNYFSYVNQKPFLFDDTLRFNITLGRDVSDKELQNAIHEAGLDELVKEKGLDSPVGENGNQLSGGQIQRIEIARALLSKRPVLLADEATSALDPHLSLDIHQTLLKNPNIAVIEVAHKISPQEKAMFDQIIHLDQPNENNN